VHSGNWRSHSQAPYDRLGPQVDNGSRGRQSDGDISEFSAQELWLSSQGSSLGGVGSLGLQGFEPTGSASASGSNRGRDTQARGLDGPAAGYRGSRRAVSAYDDGAGSGSISAPLSPHRLYAQLEMGKGPQLSQPNWPTSMIYDPRHHSTAGMPVGSSSHRPGTRSASLASGPPGSIAGDLEPTSPLPVFAPFSPAAPTSALRPLNGEPASYISPSTLLSPPTDKQKLPATAGGAAIDQLANSFDKMGVNPPGKGAENPSQARKEEVEKPASSSSSGKQGSVKPPSPSA
jgi:terminal uridylyltransferase